MTRLTFAVAIAAVFSQACLGGTAAQRRRTGTAVLVGGLAVAVAGVLVLDHYTKKDCEGPGFAPGDCFLPGMGGVALIYAGGAGMVVGGGTFLTGVRFRLKPPQDDDAARPDSSTTADLNLSASAGAMDAACTRWTRAFDGESDRDRRAKLLAARPAHCRATPRDGATF